MAEEAYRTLKWKILSLELEPGSFLNELELTAATGLGRTPVHQALHRLQFDGLVEIRPRKGVLVRKWSPQQIRHLIEARKPVEAAIVRLAAERATDKEIEAAGRLLATGRRLIAKSDRDGLLRLDQAFHRALASASRNPVLGEVLESLHQRSTLLWFVPLADRPEYEVVQSQHEAILAAVRGRDGAAAAAAMEAHLDGFIQPKTGRS
jgi:DNA-binding GntR family transcriptional regulator